MTTETLETIPDGKEVTICGIIAGMKQKMTKKGDKMAIVNLEDLSGTVEVIVFPDLYKTANHMLLTDTPLIVAGQLDKSEQGYKIKALRLHLLADVKRKGTTRVDIKLNATGLTQDDLLKVKNVGEKALGEIAELLRREGLNFGMQLEETPGGDVKVIDEGVAPQAQLTGTEEE